ncbi:hypothetical protein KL953_13935 [Mycolicibacterium goodii]|uniref:hypothetical protein n=1 Tax=Mycolicibacterium goodii TaxID=134601 RepID=UPI001BDC2FAC|nr:hypothetical protein [Mycolicibacterium goodii]MBU8809982.1 hypothetical protein [Mycolicibacterium goodii]ULN49359.1 hypothetical protein MI170_08395 [Mycolicibacterium goodii]
MAATSDSGAVRRRRTSAVLARTAQTSALRAGSLCRAPRQRRWHTDDLVYRPL